MSDKAISTAGTVASVGEPPFVDTIDRPGDAFACGTFAGSGRVVKDKKCVGKYAAAGVGYTRAEWGAFDAEAKGPNANAGYSASDDGYRAMARADLLSASASAGPVKATVGLSADTGVGVGNGGVEAKVLGTGVKLGRTMGVSLFGTGFEVKLW